jgi:hypothetical protein
VNKLNQLLVAALVEVLVEQFYYTPDHVASARRVVPLSIGRVEDLNHLIVHVFEVVVFLGSELYSPVAVELLHDGRVQFVQLRAPTVRHLLQVLPYVFYSHSCLLVPFHEAAQLLHNLAWNVLALLDEYRLKHRLEVLQGLVARVLSD